MLKDGHLVIEAIENSNAWDPKYNVPGVPMHRNPHIYIAYITRLVLRYPVAWEIYKLKIYPNILEYIKTCEKAPGYVIRRPGDEDSAHDELMGASYLSPNFANRCVRFISENDGIVELNSKDEKENAYRFLFFRSFLRACSMQYRVGFLSQALYCVHLLFSIYTGWNKFRKNEIPETSGIMKIWLMNSRMSMHVVPAIFASIWSWYYMKNGMTAKKIFSNYYLRECPIFAELAMEDLD